MKIKCHHCGIEVDKLPAEIARSQKLQRPMYCSLSCGAKHSSKIREDSKRILYSLSPNTCECCGTPLEYDKRNNRFCNGSCAAMINNRLFPKKRSVSTHKDISDNKTPTKKRTCIFCGNDVKGRKSTYCSTQCLQGQKRKIVFEKIESGDSTVSHRMYKKYLIETRGCKCEECGWNRINPKTGNCPIELEHIDGNHENNRLSNLKLLCPNCHSLTPTYKALNRGNGRHSRMERYNSGKSF